MTNDATKAYKIYHRLDDLPGSEVRVFYVHANDCGDAFKCWVEPVDQSITEEALFALLEEEWAHDGCMVHSVEEEV